METVLGVTLSVACLFLGVSTLAVLAGRLQGREQPNLEIGNAAVVGMLGGVFFYLWGWKAPLWLFGVLALWALAGALIDRLEG